MAMKAIKINAENVDALASKYLVENDDYLDVLPFGMWLVTDFGNEETFDVVADALFQTTFTNNGPIENGFVAIEYASA